MTGRYWFYLALLGQSSDAAKARDPVKRLTRLKSMAIAWMDSNVINNPGSPATSEFRDLRGNQLISNIEKKASKMKELFDRVNDDGDKRCGFYDPTVPNGGPQPYEVFVNPTKQDKADTDARQARRVMIPGQISTEDLDDGPMRDFEDKFQRIIMTHDEWRAIRHDPSLTPLQHKILEIERWFRDNIDDDDDDEGYDNHRLRRGTNRISSDPIKSLKQLGKGFKNWSERYIAYCGQEYISKRFSKEWANDKLWKKGEHLYRCKIMAFNDEDC